MFPQYYPRIVLISKYRNLTKHIYPTRFLTQAIKEVERSCLKYKKKLLNFLTYIYKLGDIFYLEALFIKFMFNRKFEHVPPIVSYGVVNLSIFILLRSNDSIYFWYFGINLARLGRLGQFRLSFMFFPSIMGTFHRFGYFGIKSFMFSKYFKYFHVV